MQRFLSALPIRWALLLVTGLWSILAVAQSTCPELKVSDFKVNYYAANADCGTDGQIIVTYRNNVAGFSKLTYETSTDGATWGNPVEQTMLSVPTAIPLTGWAAGQTIHLRVTGTCPSGTQTLVLTPIVHRSDHSHTVATMIETTPSGGCAATAGSVKMGLDNVTGFTKAEYQLYQGAMLIEKKTSNTPYFPTTFYNLPSGNYKVVTRAIPACTPTSPTPTFKNGAYEVEQTVKVGYFSILPTPIPTRGTACAGGVRVAVARVMGVNTLKYEVLPAGGGTALQTEQLTYPNFNHTFLNLTNGNYELRATSDCGTVETVPFTVPIGSAGTLSASVLQGTYTHCAFGKIAATIPGTSVACPVDYTLTPDGGGTPITKLGVTEETVIFEDLAKGNYTISATWAGQTQTVTTTMPVVSLGTLKVTTQRADDFCSPTGALTVALENGVYLTHSTLILYNSGTPIRTFTLSPTERTKTIGSLMPGEYMVKLRLDCGEEITTAAPLGAKDLLGADLRLYDTKQSECEEGHPYTLSYSDDLNPGDEPDSWKKFLQGATYEVVDPVSGEALASGLFPEKTIINTYGSYGYVIKNVKQSASGQAVLKVTPSCGTPILKITGDYGNATLYSSFPTGSVEDGTNLPVRNATYSPECEALGGALIDIGSITPNKTYRLVVKKEGIATPVYTEDFSSDQTYTSFYINDLSSGKYTYELYGCQPQIQLFSKQFEITSTPDFVGHIIETNYSKETPTGYTNVGLRFQLNLPKNTKVTVTGASGYVKTITLDEKHYSPSFSFLPYDTYTVSVEYPSLGCPTSITFPKTFTIERSKEDVDFYLKTKAKYGDFCTNNTQVEVYLEPMYTQSQLTGAVTYQAYDEENHLLDTKTAATYSDKVVLTPLSGSGYIVATTSKGKITQKYGKEANYYSPSWLPNGAPKNVILVQPRPKYVGCQEGGTIEGTSRLRELGLPDKPTKVYLGTDGHYVINYVDSIASPGIIDHASFTGLSDNVYFVQYHYCDAVYGESVELRTQYKKTELNIESYAPSPCTGGGFKITGFPKDYAINIDYTVIDKSNNLEVKKGQVTAGEPIITDIPKGDYYVQIKAGGPCFELAKEFEGSIGETAWDVYYYNYSTTLDCYSSGWIAPRIETDKYPNIAKVDYVLQPEGGGTVYTASTNTPEKEEKFVGLPPGTYKLTAAATCKGSVTPSPDTWEGTIELPNSYQTLKVLSYPLLDKGTELCPTTGSIGLRIQGGNSGDDKALQVTIVADQNGPLATPKVLRPVNYYSQAGGWGGDLAPGTYTVKVFDGCTEQTLPNLTVPLISNPPTARLEGCVYRSFNCTMVGRVRLDFATPPGNVPFEVAVVPTGSTRTTAWSDQIYEGGMSYSYALIADSFPEFNIAAGGDILVRKKNCPGTEQRFHFNSASECELIPIQANNDPCSNKITFSITTRDPDKLSHCKKFDLVLRKGMNDESQPELLRRTFEISHTNIPAKWWKGYYGYILPEFTRNKDDDYTLFAYEHGTNRKIETAPAFHGQKPELLVKYSPIGPTDCMEESLAWLIENDCTVGGYIVVRDNDTGVELERSKSIIYSQPRRTTFQRKFWESKIRYQRGKTYHIDFVDKDGNTLLSTKHVHTVEYETPTDYTLHNLTYNNSCGETGYTLHHSFTTGGYPPGMDPEKGRTVKIVDLKCTHTPTGDVYYPENYDERGNFSTWKVRKSDGTISPVIRYAAGNYTFTATDLCGATATGTFTVNENEVAVFEPRDPEVTLDCEQRFHITPKDVAYFKSGKEPVTMDHYEIYDKGWKNVNWGTKFESFDVTPSYTPYYRFQDGSICQGGKRYLDLRRYFLTFDASQSLTFYCAASHQGVITIGLKAGNPPYTYTLMNMDGTVIDTHANVNGPTTFYTGQLGEEYKLVGTDRCGLTKIFQTVKIQDPAKIGLAMNRDLYFCEGDPLKYDPLNLFGATYQWSGPNGFSSTNRVLELPATTSATSGTYLLKVTPPTCTTTIDATVNVHVVKVKEVLVPTQAHICAGQTALINIGEPDVKSDGAPTTLHQYQWQVNDNPTNPRGWKVVPGGTEAQLSYAPFLPGTYYLRRVTTLGSCSDISAVSTLVVDPGLTQNVSTEELNVTIDHKNPFTLTAGMMTGSLARTYQWQRSLNKTSWTNIPGATHDTFTETDRYGSIVYYKRVTTSGTCVVESPIITVRFKKRYPAMVNPHLRQRVLTE